MCTTTMFSVSHQAFNSEFTTLYNQDISTFHTQKEAYSNQKQQTTSIQVLFFT